MKVASTLLGFLLGLAAFSANAVSIKSQENPITKVAKLMQDLSVQIEKDEEKEQKLFDQFMCWGETTVAAKKQSNAEASSRIQSLQAYVADLDGGKVELTDERETLEAELNQLNADLEKMEQTRKSEHEDFMSASSEMKKALTAMDKAIDVLKVATAPKAKGELMQTETHEAETFAAQQSQASTLAYAADLGERFLSNRDALFLRRILTGDVPANKDWKKLNRKADFKKSYKSRSGNIQKVLGKMRLTFERNLEDAVKKEEAAQTEYDDLHAAKTTQRDKTQTAYENGDAEKGAQAEARQNSMDELNALTTQVDNDTRFITQTEDAMQAKRVEWGARMNLRAGEKEALAKAVAVLRSDDARDLFKSSMASDDEVFLQVNQQAAAGMTRKSAADLLRGVADKAGDKRLAFLATRIAFSGGKFGEIIKSINEMVSVLKDEESNDLEDKEKCEKTRKEDTREAAVQARDVDDQSDTMNRLEAENDDTEKEISANKEASQKAKEEIDTATEQRKEQRAEWQSSDQDDANAADLVRESRNVLSSFYEQNGMVSLSQVDSDQAPGTAPAGQAPLPPPSTWEEPYGGKAAESQGIIAILETIEEDIRKDRQKAAAEEKEAAAAYKQMVKETKAQIESLEDATEQLEAVVAEKKTEIKSTKEEQVNSKDSLDAVLKKMKDLKPGCDFLLVNYKMRLENRQMEMDGLAKAKAILKGAAFDAPDKNREMKPGDALLSIHRHRRH